MKDEARLALDSIKKDNEELKKIGTDGSPDINAPSTYEDRSVMMMELGVKPLQKKNLL